MGFSCLASVNLSKFLGVVLLGRSLLLNLLFVGSFLRFLGNVLLQGFLGLVGSMLSFLKVSLSSMDGFFMRLARLLRGLL